MGVLNRLKVDASQFHVAADTSLAIMLSSRLRTSLPKLARGMATEKRPMTR